jgi:hypothetical protein
VELEKRIMEEEIVYDISVVSPEAIELMRGLLNKDPKERFKVE